MGGEREWKGMGRGEEREGGKGRRGRGEGTIQFLASGRHRLSYATGSQISEESTVSPVWG